MLPNNKRSSPTMMVQKRKCCRTVVLKWALPCFSLWFLFFLYIVSSQHEMLKSKRQLAKLEPTSFGDSQIQMLDQAIRMASSGAGFQAKGTVNSTATRSKPSPLVAFYNIYTHSDTAGEERTRAIITEQLEQLGCSYATLTSKFAVYYNTIGKPLDTGYIQSICEKTNLDCVHLQHYDRAFEDVTLQAMHDFCTTHDDYRALYIHSKGSYNDREEISFSQKSWRSNMMSAITSDMCVEPPDDRCDICGLIALPWPILHFPGNFFSAKCNYVKKLMPPRLFSERLKNVTMKALVRMVEGDFVSNLLPGKLGR